MAKRNISLTLDEGLLERAEALGRGEPRSVLIERLLTEAVRVAEEAAIDAAYERAYAERPMSAEDHARLDAMTEAAVRSSHAEWTRGSSQ